MDLERLLAQRVRQIEASGIRKVFDTAATMTDPIDFSIGQPDFDVPDPVKEAAIAAIRAGYNRYTPSAGTPALRDRLRRWFRARHGVEPDDVIVTSGCLGALTLACLAVLGPEDEFLIPDPYFLAYPPLATICGAKAVCYDTYPDFRVKPTLVERLITPRTKAILVMSPANPTGMCLDDETRRELAGIARRHKLLVISDEIYDLFDYTGNPGRSLAAFYPEGTLCVGGLGKTAAMTGWRLGWGLGPHWLVHQMIKLQQYTLVCAPSMVQRGAIAALDLDMSPVVAEYRGKRDRMLAGLRDVGYEVATPDGAFYLFVKTPPAYPDSHSFCQAAFAHRLLVVPGNVFSRQDTHFRLSYAATDKKLDAGIKILRTMYGGPGGASA